MNRLARVLAVASIVLNAFLAVTAFAGGVGIVSGLAAPPIAQLEGSVFRDYTVPGLSLFVIVGGMALVAAVLLVRRDPLATLFSIGAGVVIMVFEFVEVLVIGSPPGPALALQLFYFALGLLIVIVSTGLSLFTFRSAEA